MKVFLSLLFATAAVFASWNVPEKPDALILFCGNSNLELAKSVAAEFDHALEGASTLSQKFLALFLSQSPEIELS